MKNTLWWNGPKFLTQTKDFWPRHENFAVENFDSLDTDVLSVNENLICNAQYNISEIIPVERFSDLSKLFRVTAFVLRFVNNLKARIRGNDLLHGDLKPAEMENARMKLLLSAQQHIRDDKNFDNLKSNLNVFEDENKLLRCRGRLENAPLDFESRCPIILPREHHITDLIIRQCHENVKHNGVKDTLTELRSNYWIVRGRQKVKKFVDKCCVCKKVEGRSYTAPPQPPLPNFRLDIGHAFNKFGIDFAEPMFGTARQTKPGQNAQFVEVEN